MRTIKFVTDTAQPIIATIEGHDNNMTVADFISIMLRDHNVTVDLNKTVLTELKSKAVYSTSDAILPDGDLKLFTTVKDPKGNGKFDGLSRSEIYATIKEFINSDGDRARNHFSQYGSYTQVASVDLIQLLRSYRPSKSKTTTGAIAMRTPVKTGASKSSAQDKDIADLLAAQNSYRPNLTRKNRNV
jgi:hypothetical protein